MAAENSLILTILIGSLIIVITGGILRYFKQPSIIAYILTGMLIGPSGLGWVTSNDAISKLGEIGIILLLFFIGMEVSLPEILSNWRTAIMGTNLQILLSIAMMSLFGYFFHWSASQVLLLGFVISLSSTAILIKILEDKKELQHKRGKQIVSILLVQDIAVAPLLIIVSLLGSENITFSALFLQCIGVTLFVLLAKYLVNHSEITIPFKNRFQVDYELQIFAALIACFGLAALASLFHLSAALGAFLAGMVIAKTKETHWVKGSLQSFRVLFVALFFASIGMLLDASFLKENIRLIALLVAVVFLINTFINSVIFRYFGESWPESLYSGSMLAQIGEFSFIIAAMGLKLGLLPIFSYQLVIVTIGLTLFLSPFWIGLFRIVKVLSGEKG